MKKNIYSIILFVLFSQYAFEKKHIGKKEFVLDAAYKYAPLDSSFYDLLDTLSNSLQNCIFNALDRDYIFNINIYEENKIRGQIYSYLSYPRGVYPSHLETYRDVKKANKGFFYYNEKLVLVTFVGERWSQFEVEQYFSRSYCLQAIMYSIPAETLPEVGMGLEVATLQGFYDQTTGNLTVTELYGCKGERYYSYTVQKGDTWEILAEKFATTVENIRTLNGKYDEREVPEKGHPITVHYKIVNGVLEVKRERTRFDP